MQSKIFKQLDEYHYKRYLLVLVLLILAFVFGKNMNIFTPEQQQWQDQIYAEQKIAAGIYDIPAGQSEFEIKKLFMIKKGQCGRLFFDLKNLPLADNSGDFSYENTEVKVLLSNDLDENQNPGLFELGNDGFVKNKEIDFCANADYSNLLFRRNENSSESSFEISDIFFNPLAVSKSNFANLQTPVTGDTGFNNPVYQSGLDLTDATSALKFTRHNQLIGQTFVADSDTISGVDIKVEFEGSGGIGGYFLDLREVDRQDGKVKLLPNRIAYFNFDKDSAEKNLRIGRGVYHIPLAAHLEKGKTYFIGISNEAVKFNVLNTLKIFGGAKSKDGEQIINIVGGKINEKQGSLYMKVYGADYVEATNEKVLTGAKILDNGDGTGQYIYEQKGNFSDYLDLDQLLTNKITSIFYDNIAGGISSKDEDSNAFVYKINTIYPFTKMKIEAGQPGGGFKDSLVYYSFDNINWIEIKNDLDKDESLQEGDENKFQELLRGDGRTKTVYIKVTYDREDAKEKTVHLFGLRSLKVNAQLVLGK